MGERLAGKVCVVTGAAQGIGAAYATAMAANGADVAIIDLKRIDQATEVPVPDAPSRDKLVRLYARGLKLADALVAEAVQRTDGVSAAFIKELMRRTAQAAIARGDGAKKVVEPCDADLSEALDDMLFSGGQLNVKLVGGAPAS